MPAATLERSRPDAVRSASDWLRLASDLSREFKQTVVERERTRQRPVAELRKFRETGLVNLLIPEKFGGAGGSVLLATRVVRELCKGDTSVGALLGYHFINGGIPRLFDPAGGAEEIERASAANRWLWGNVTQPFAPDFAVTPAGGGGFLLDGTKPLSTGPSLGDVTTVIAVRKEAGDVLFAYLPTDRKGLRYGDDWDHLGFRLSETVSVSFERVEVLPHEVIRAGDGSPTRGFPPFYLSIGELFFANYLIGAALGAYEQARDYTRTQSRPYFASGVDAATKDPFILHVYGGIWAKLQALVALSDTVAEKVDRGYARRLEITPEERGELYAEAAAVRALAIEFGLDVTAKIFETTGTRSTAAKFGLDRYWRDIRTHSLHDPVAHKLKTIGDFALNGKASDSVSFIHPSS